MDRMETSIKIPAVFFLCFLFLTTAKAQVEQLPVISRPPKKETTSNKTGSDNNITTTAKEAAENKAKADTTKKEKSLASKASLRSAILPGWGQAYNKKYWKIPIVYGVLAIPVSTFRYNSDWYGKTRFAYTARVTRDTANYAKIAPELIPLSTESLRLYRNSFRKNMDFSILGLLVVWGLNIVDAAVDGHLRTFTITDDLAVRLSPTVPLASQGQFGVTASFHFGKQGVDKSTSY